MPSLPRPGISGRFGARRIARGLTRKSGQFHVSFQFAPDWERSTKKAVDPSGREMARRTHDAMADAMRHESRRNPGGGTATDDDGWRAGIGSPPQTHTHWHLLEFGGGYHFARSPVRNALRRLGKYRPAR